MNVKHTIYLMDCCSICYDDFDPNIVIEVLVDGEKVPSMLCKKCILRMKYKRIDEYIQNIVNETCPASVKRMARGFLPTAMSVDCTGFGKLINELWIHGVSIGTNLLSWNFSKEELDEIMANLLSLKDIEDDAVLLVEKEILFGKFRRGSVADESADESIINDSSEEK